LQKIVKYEGGDADGEKLECWWRNPPLSPFGKGGSKRGFVVRGFNLADRRFCYGKWKGIKGSVPMKKNVLEILWVRR